MQQSITVLNQLCSDLGGTTTHKFQINALNELCTLAGGTGNHMYVIQALNELCTLYSATAGHKYVIDALRSLYTTLGGVGSFSTDVQYYSAIQHGGVLNVSVTIPTGYIHPMLPDLSIKRESGVATIQGKTINNFRKVLETPIIKYVDATNGVDTNNGDTAGTAYKTLTKLLTATYDRAYFTAGIYTAIGGTTLSNDTELICSSGNALLFKGYQGSGLVWTAVGDGSFSRNITSTVVNVIDSRVLDANGDYNNLVKKTSAAEVSANPGSWWYDSGAAKTLYVRLSDDAEPSATTFVCLSSYTHGSGKTIYLEGITILGGIANTTNATETKSVLCAKNSKLTNNISNNAYSATGNYWIWLENTIATKGYLDGFNYHSSGSYHPAVVEIGCTGRSNGLSKTDSINNGTTGHESAVILRMTGSYHSNEGPNVHDVNSVKSLNIDCVSGESSATIAGNKSSFAVATDVGEAATMWLDGCTGGTVTTFGAENRAPLTSVIKVKRCTMTNVEEGTSLVAYT